MQFKNIYYGYIENNETEKKILENLVRTVVRRFSETKIPQEDLVSWGKEGLEEAKRRYVPNCGFKFVPYAAWFIKQSITIGIENRTKE